MMLFWIITAAMILVALAIIAPALLKKGPLEELDRDQQNVVIARDRLAELQSEYAAGSVSEDQFEQAKLELEQALLFDLGDEKGNPSVAIGTNGPWVLLASAVFVSVLSVAIYYKIGMPELIDPADTVVQQPQEGEQKMPSVEEMVTALTARLKEVPDDSQGWYLLGRTYMVRDDFPKAAAAFERLYTLVDDQPSIMLALADATSMANGGDLKGRPTELIRKAIVLAPEDPTALWLVGMAEDQAQNHQLAIDYWSKLRGLLPEDPESLQRVEGLIKGAQAKLMAAGGVAVETEVPPKPAAASSGIRVTVSVADPLKAQVNPDATLFVYARAVEGPKMPLAAVRLKASDLPTEVTLDDTTAMAPSMKLSSRKAVLVGALISNQGSATAQVGDLRGEVSPVMVGNQELTQLIIDLEVK